MQVKGLFMYKIAFSAMHCYVYIFNTHFDTAQIFNAFYEIL